MKWEEVVPLFESERARLVQRIAGIVGCSSLAEDLAQEAFLRLFERGESFEGRAQLSTWLYRVATNLALNRRRDSARQERLLQSHGEALLPCRPPAPGIEVDISRILERADPQTRRVLVLVYLEDHTRKAAGAVVGMSQPTLRKRIAALRASVAA